jgi:hypothetical protein
MTETLCANCTAEERVDCWFLQQASAIQANVNEVANRLDVTTGDLNQAKVDFSSLSPEKQGAVTVVYDASVGGGRVIEQLRQQARSRECRQVNDRTFKLPGQ